VVNRLCAVCGTNRKKKVSWMLVMDKEWVYFYLLCMVFDHGVLHALLTPPSIPPTGAASVRQAVLEGEGHGESAALLAPLGADP